MTTNTFPYPFNLPLQGTVSAAGTLEIGFGPSINQMWNVSQVSWKMLTAPAGATIELLYGGSSVAPGYSARRGAFGGDPPLYLQGGEDATVSWTACTPGDIGQVLIIYDKVAY